MIRLSRKLLAELDSSSDGLCADHRTLGTGPFQRLADCASGWFWEADADFCFTVLSDQFEAITGLARKDILGKTPQSIAGEDSTALPWSSIRAGLSEGAPIRDLLCPVRASDGSTRYWQLGGDPHFDDQGSLVGYRGIGLDITAQRATEAELRESEARYRLALRSINEGVYDWDIQGNKIYYSDRVLEVLGFTAEELSTTNDWERRIHPEDLPQYREILIRHLKGESDHFLCEFRYAAVDGTWRWALQRGIALRDASGRAYRMGGSTGDVTAEKEAKAALLEREAQLSARLGELEEAHVDLERQSAKLTVLADELRAAKSSAEAANNAKSDFLATMSHELRTPLNGILGMAEVLLQEHLDGKARQQIEVVRDCGNTLLVLLDDILDLSKIEAGKVELENLDFEVEQLLRSVEMIWSPRMKDKGLQFSIDVDPTVPAVLRTDPSRLRQLLFNYLSNAVKFTDQGEITLRLKLDAVPDGALMLYCEVEDSGIGIDEVAQQRLFTKFTQADSSTTRNYGGSGLGLAICKELATLMGGTVGVRSKLGKGSVFWLSVACEEGNPNRVASHLWRTESAANGEAAAERKLQILLAEDNKINQTVLRSILERSGHTVYIVENGVEAVRVVRDRSFDVILMDVQMPEMDGVSATQWIREMDGNLARIPIIAVTANAMAGDRERYLAVGMDDYVSKPVDPFELYDAISRCVGGRVASGASEPAPDAKARDAEGNDSDLTADAEEGLQGLLEELGGLAR